MENLLKSICEKNDIKMCSYQDYSQLIKDYKLQDFSENTVGFCATIPLKRGGKDLIFYDDT